MACARLRAGHAAQGAGFEVADIFRAHFPAFRDRYGPGPSAVRVARDLIRCRTAALGGHLDVCTTCGFTRPAYNSCRNRHCPKCQALRQARWVEQRLTRLVPTHYFHVVFTLPRDLHRLVRRNRARLYTLLLRSAAAALEALARDPKWLTESAQLAITAVLHTWTRDLRFHPHVHCIVSGGGLSLDGTRWVAAPPDFLFPVHVLGTLFRGKFLAGLTALLAARTLADDAADRAARRRRQRLYDASWVVYAKRPFGGPQQVFRYLGHYTHRVAISNRRLVHLDDATVVFRTRGRAHTACPPVEFIRRFLDHVLPARFVKIRHFGLFAAVHVRTRLAHARHLLATTAVAISPDPPGVPHAPRVPDPRPSAALLLELTGIDLACCPLCRQRTMVRRPLPGECRGPPHAPSRP
jgi:hypothetical protein